MGHTIGYSVRASWQSCCDSGKGNLMELTQRRRGSLCLLAASSMEELRRGLMADLLESAIPTQCYTGLGISVYTSGYTSDLNFTSRQFLCLCCAMHCSCQEGQARVGVTPLCQEHSLLSYGSGKATWHSIFLIGSYSDGGNFLHGRTQDCPPLHCPVAKTSCLHGVM